MQFEWVYVVLNTFKRILKWFVFIKSSPCNRLHCLCWWEGMEMLEIFACHTAVHFTDWKWISKTVYCIRYVMVCKIGFAKWNTKIALLGASMVVTYCIKLFQTGADRYSGILMSLLLLLQRQKALFCATLTAEDLLNQLHFYGK